MNWKFLYTNLTIHPGHWEIVTLLAGGLEEAIPTRKSHLRRNPKEIGGWFGTAPLFPGLSTKKAQKLFKLSATARDGACVQQKFFPSTGESISEDFKQFVKKFGQSLTGRGATMQGRRGKSALRAAEVRAW